MRERGIYHAQGTLAGSFRVPADFGLGAEAGQHRIGMPWLAIGVDDMRGIGNVPELWIDGQRLPFRPGTQGSALGDGTHAPLADVAIAGRESEFEVGLALAVFYLLLLSLSEHIGFAAAYAVSASACVLLIGSHVGAMLGGARRGCGFAAALGGLYALLYGLLGSEDYALLIGSVRVFALLATVMLFTRRVDWNALGDTRPPC